METMLEMLKIDLGIVTTAYDSRLLQLLEYSADEIKRAGATTIDATNPRDMQLIVMYAAWTWRRRDTMQAMPRMLRYALNNRVFAEKMQEG